MSGFRWGDFDQFYWLAALVIWALVYFWSEKNNQKKLAKAFGSRLAPWLSQSISLSKLRWRWALQTVGLFFVIVALARPQLGQSQQEVVSEGVELMIVFDVSDSMLAEDIKPSRLQRAKVEVEKLVDLMPGNKIGLIAFAGSSTLMSPLTTDPAALKMYLQSLDTQAVSTQGTSFEAALQFVKSAFEKGGVTQSESQKTTRVALIVSDGEDHEPNALKEAEELVKSGVRLITLAYGTEKGGTIPARDRTGHLTGVRKDKNDQPIITQVKGDFLKELSRKDDGAFFMALTSGNHIGDIAAQIEKYEKAEFSSSVTMQYNEIFMYPLLVGILSILLSLILNVRQTDKKTIEALYGG